MRGLWSDTVPTGWAVDEDDDELRGTLRHLVESNAYASDRKAVAAAAARHSWARSAKIFEDVMGSAPLWGRGSCGNWIASYVARNS